MYNIGELNQKLISELREIAERFKVKSYKTLSKEELIYKILDQQAVLPVAEIPQKKHNEVLVAPLQSKEVSPSVLPRKSYVKSRTIDTQNECNIQGKKIYI